MPTINDDGDDDEGAKAWAKMAKLSCWFVSMVAKANLTQTLQYQTQNKQK